MNLSQLRFVRPLVERASIRWERWAIVIGVLVLSVQVGRRPWQIPVEGLVGLLAAAAFLRWPWVGLVTLVVAGLSIPFSLSTGTQTDLNVAILLTGLLSALLFLEIFGLRRQTFVRSSAIWPLLALCGATLLAFVAGLQPWHLFAGNAPLASQLGGVTVFLLSAAAFLLAAHQLKTLAQLRILMWVFLGLAALYIAARLLSFSTPFYWPGAPLGAAYSLLWVWVVASALSQALFNRSLLLGARLALLALALATLAVAWFQGQSWVSGWLPSLLAGLVVVWLRSWRVGFVLTAASLAYLNWSQPELLSGLVDSDAYSIATRNVARDILMQDVFPLSPILGLGPANYYWYTPVFPILGYAVRFNSHNNYVDILLQIGSLGMLCFGWFILSIGWLGWKLRGAVKEDFARAFVNGALAGLAGTLVAAWLGDWFLPFVYNIGLTGFRSSVLAWLFLGALVAVEQMQRRGDV